MAATAPIFKNQRATYERVEKFISQHHFTDCNLYGKQYKTDECPKLEIIGVDCGQERLKFAEAKQKLADEGAPVSIGHKMGPTWSTHWFKVSGDIPKNVSMTATGLPQLLWDSECEAMVWSEDGRPLQGLSGDWNRTTFDLSSKNISTLPGEKFTYYIECACNSMFGAGDGGQIEPPNPNKEFTLKTAKIAVLRNDVYAVLRDMEILLDLAKELPEGVPAKNKALFTANSMVNVLCMDPANQAALGTAHKLYTDAMTSVTQNERSSFELYAVGNCHIDTAWLWPYDETRRKCARSWSATLRLMKKYPELRFAVSQAQQLRWLQEDYPSLFDEIQTRAAEQRFIPVGGCWVEMDGNLPSGESFVRQMLYGQKAFKEMFGSYCTEFWLPDTFGYSAQLPQIMHLAGMDRFVTQKISWSLVNKFPHNTFYWVGIDGTKVLTHFPPGGSYVREVTVADCVEQQNECLDLGRCNRAIMLYGHGDGGGGPTKRMCERLRRLVTANTAACGLPTVHVATPAQFFEEIEKHDTDKICSWHGELYLELHQGTFTTQAAVKKSNRELETLLHNCEIIAALLFIMSGGVLRRKFEEEWEKVLLNQFHDVLPGSSIKCVYDDAHRLYEEVYASLRNSIHQLTTRLPEASTTKCSDDKTTYFVNSLPWSRTHRISKAGSADANFISLPPLSVSRGEPLVVAPDFELIEHTDHVILGNQYLRASVLRNGRITGLWSRKSLSEEPPVHLNLVSNGLHMNAFRLYHDVPLYWDAWDIMDYHLETAVDILEVLQPLKILTTVGQLALEFSLRISQTSKLKQVIKLDLHQPFLEFKTEVEWHEKHRLLKWEHDANIVAPAARYDVQFGHVDRPTHQNTSWDSAKHEVCGHKYALLSDGIRGLAMLNKAKYGHSCRTGRLCLSLLRGPTAPDANADQGLHIVETALMPVGDGNLATVVRKAYEFNFSVQQVDRWFNDMNVSVIKNELSTIHLSTVKVSELFDGVVLRFYEPHGTRAVERVQLGSVFKEKIISIFLCDLLERPLEINDSNKTVIDVEDNMNEFLLNLCPFQIVSVYLKL